MRLSLTAPAAFVLSASAALAHTGHIGDLAGHDHWLAAAAIAAAVAIGVATVLKGRRGADDTDASGTDEPEAEAQDS